MTDDAARAATLLTEHRESIDRLDAILVFTLAERFKHTQAVGQLKAAHDLPPSDPAREAAQIARLEELAQSADLDPAFRAQVSELRHRRGDPPSPEAAILGRDYPRQTQAIKGENQWP